MKNNLYLNDVVVYYLEDDIGINESTKFFLDAYFPKVRSFYDGKEAFDYFEKTKELPDLIITDIRMPKIDGIEFVKIFKGLGHDIPSVFITGHNDFEYMQSAIDLKIEKYILKPVLDIEELLESIKSVLAHRKKSDYESLINSKHLSKTIVIDNGKLVYANDKFLEFFDCKSLDEYTQNYKCVSKNFIKDENYYYPKEHHSPEFWVNDLLKLEEDKRIVLLEDKKSSTKKVFFTGITKTKLGLAVSFYDISKTIEKKFALREKANKDPLTNAFNRNYFNDNIDLILQRNQQNRFKTAVVMLDIDHFKEINDSYGHDIGDLVLKELIDVIKQNIRDNDIIIRWGGEEFLLLFYIKEIKDLKTILENIRESISNHEFTCIKKLTCSIGAAIHENDINMSIKNADQALYDVKLNGRDDIKVREY